LVHVEADSNAQFNTVIQAMDLVREAQGDFIMLSPNVRAEAEGKDP
jgi:biopolymer transport protein ExbD